MSIIGCDHLCRLCRSSFKTLLAEAKREEDAAREEQLKAAVKEREMKEKATLQKQKEMDMQRQREKEEAEAAEAAAKRQARVYVCCWTRQRSSKAIVE